MPKVHRVIEFASVRGEGGKIVDEYEQLFAYKDQLPPIITAITRIHDEDLKGAPRIEDVREEILSHIGPDTIIVGQNVSFDIGILHGEEIDLRARPWIDTSMLASLLFPELPSYSLASMSAHLNLNHEPVHRALGDVNATLELFGKCWERLCELPEDMRTHAQEVTSNSDEGYRKLFAALPPAIKSERPSWCVPSLKSLRMAQSQKQDVTLHTPEVATVELLEEPPAPVVLQTIIDAACNDESTVHWIAVKNVEATLQQLTLSDDVRVLYPPQLLARENAKDMLAGQSTLTADEATLLLKLQWYGDEHRTNLPIHGNERSVWNGAIACTESSPRYTKQFEDLPTVILIDHRQLLRFLADPEHAAKGALTENAHVIIDDASMLEDTATKAYGWYASVNDLRAAAERDAELTGILDLLEIWIERTRNLQDMYYLAEKDVTSHDAKGLREKLENYLQKNDTGENAAWQLTHLSNLLSPDHIHDRITYIEHRIDRTNILRSVPERVGTFLRDHLYGTHPTTLLIPPGSSKSLHEILPAEVDTVVNSTLCESLRPSIEIAFEKDRDLQSILADPPDGHTIILTPSKRSIDDIYIKHAEHLEQQGIQLICQGISGGMGRTTAAFLSADAPAILIMTPWAYEGIELPPDIVSTLILLRLPFDHPSHAVLSRRAEHYQNPFMEYSLPRMQQRLFRLMRTFSQHATKSAEMLFLDERLETKPYGKKVWADLKTLARV